MSANRSPVVESALTAMHGETRRVTYMSDINAGTGAAVCRRFSALHPVSLRRAANTLLTLLLLLPASTLWAQDLVRISELTSLDRQYMGRQRQSIDDLAQRFLGRGCCSGSEDVPVLQRLLDEGVVSNDQRRELQAMGIVLGDMLAAELGMDWVIYEDKLGRSRALRLGETDNYLFPATMISRRREADNEEPVQEVYERAMAAIEPLLPPKPYQ